MPTPQVEFFDLEPWTNFTGLRGVGFEHAPPMFSHNFPISYLRKGLMQNITGYLLWLTVTNRGIPPHIHRQGLPWRATPCLFDRTLHKVVGGQHIENGPPPPVGQCRWPSHGLCRKKYYGSLRG